MNIIPLKGVFPLNKKITLSKYWKIELDNPRTPNEQSYFRQLLEEHIEFRDDDKRLKNYFFMSEGKTILHKKYLKKILIGLKQKSQKNEYIDKTFLKHYDPKEAFNYLANSWLIVRFDDEGFFEKLREEQRQMRKRKERGLFILQGNEVGAVREENASNFAAILSLLFLDVFEGRLTKTIELETEKRSLTQELFIYLHQLSFPDKKFKEFDYQTVMGRIDDMVRWGERIDLLSSEQKGKLMFVGEMIRNVNENTINSRMQLLMLVSIIEFLLTHNPDYSRFNVEDSISKQFQLKAGVLIKQKNKGDFAAAVKKLKNLYDIRSMIAHGDWNALDRYMRSVTGRKDSDMFDFVEIAFNYIKIIVEAYINDPSFIEALKKL